MPIKEPVHHCFQGDPPAFNCPECACDDEVVALKHTDRATTQWGSVVTTYLYYRCKRCKNRFVSTNGRDPAIASDRR